MSINKGTPRSVLFGIKDVSPSQQTAAPEQLPQHLPLVPLLTEKGPEFAIVDSVQLAAMHGSISLEPTSKFCNHQTMLASKVIARGNMIAAVRIKPENAKTSMLRISLELIPNTMPVFERENDGGVKLHPIGHPQAGQPVILEIAGEPQYTNGYRAVLWVGTDIYADVTKRGYSDGSVVSAYRLGSFTPPGAGAPLGVLTDPDNVLPDFTPSSVLYPIMDLEASSFGEHGDGYGLRVISPTTDDAQPFDTATALSVRAYLYRLAVTVRNSRGNSAVLKEMLGGGVMSDLTLKQNAVQQSTGFSFSLDEVFIDKYQKTNDPNFNPVYGPFGKVHVYHSELNQLLNRITQGEIVGGFTIPGEKQFDTMAAPFGRVAGVGFTDAANSHLFNIFSGYDYNGVPYFTYDVDNSVAYGGTSLKGDRTVYASGGSDGLEVDSNGFPDRLKNLQIYDDAVKVLFDNFHTNETIRFMDMAKYPISTIWDSGFSLETKKSMLWPMALRKDLFVVQVPQSIADYTTVPGETDPVWVKKPRLTREQQRSVAGILRATAQNYPESTVYGTSVCRVVILGHTGFLLNSTYSDYLPLSVDLADKVANYMGAANGNWVDGRRFDRHPLNVVTTMRDVDSDYQTEQAYDVSWDLGLVWVQSSDRRSCFYPAFQTVYTEDTSVLNSMITVMACCTIEKVVHQAWIRHTGNTDLDDAQFIKSVNEFVLSQLTGARFGARFAFEVDTYFTAQDKLLGNQWTTDVHIYTNVMKSVGKFSIVSHRLDELGN